MKIKYKNRLMSLKKTIAIMINNKHYIYGHKIKLKTTIFYLSNVNIKLNS